MISYINSTIHETMLCHFAYKIGRVRLPKPLYCLPWGTTLYPNFGLALQMPRCKPRVRSKSCDSAGARPRGTRARATTADPRFSFTPPRR
jgi:hypothetical protein